jgi:2-polyprenyl-3-methyl-5-hydroxy-6-metoxy-1,4-benzoquinol methylase
LTPRSPPDYESAIEQERSFWDHFHSDALRYGIPHWLDLRKATRLRRPVHNPFDDPRVEGILRGTEKKEFLRMATQAGPGIKALDFGCGMGWLSLELARAGLETDGLDLSPRSVDIARDYATTQNPAGRLRFRAADLNQEDLGQEIYDVIAVWDVLHHLAQVDVVAQRFARALKPGGVLVVWDHIGMQQKNLRFYRWFHYLVPAHPRMYANKVRRWLRMPGLDVFRGETPAESPASEAGGLPVPDAPFEHHSEDAILPALRKWMPGITIRTHLCFAMHLAHYHRLPVFGQYCILRILKRLDEWMIQTGILRGEYFIGFYRKPASEVSVSGGGP